MGSVKQEIETLLKEAFSPTLLEVVDQSHLHAGHREAGNAVESHFSVTIVAEAFAGKPPLTQQRMVYKVLDDILKNQIHALQLKTRSS